MATKNYPGRGKFSRKRFKKREKLIAEEKVREREQRQLESKERLRMEMAALREAGLSGRQARLARARVKAETQGMARKRNCKNQDAFISSSRNRKRKDVSSGATVAAAAAAKIGAAWLQRKIKNQGSNKGAGKAIRRGANDKGKAPGAAKVRGQLAVTGLRGPHEVANAEAGGKASDKWLAPGAPTARWQHSVVRGPQKGPSVSQDAANFRTRAQVPKAPETSACSQAKVGQQSAGSSLCASQTEGAGPTLVCRRVSRRDTARGSNVAETSGHCCLAGGVRKEVMGPGPVCGTAAEPQRPRVGNKGNERDLLEMPCGRGQRTGGVEFGEGLTRGVEEQQQQKREQKEERARGKEHHGILGSSAISVGGSVRAAPSKPSESLLGNGGNSDSEDAEEAARMAAAEAVAVDTSSVLRAAAAVASELLSAGGVRRKRKARRGRKSTAASKERAKRRRAGEGWGGENSEEEEEEDEEEGGHGEEGPGHCEDGQEGAPRLKFFQIRAQDMLHRYLDGALDTGQRGDGAGGDGEAACGQSKGSAKPKGKPRKGAAERPLGQGPAGSPLDKETTPGELGVALFPRGPLICGTCRE